LNSEFSMIEIHGYCDERFSPVREVFARNFADKDEVGASLALTVEGEMVVDMWAGHRDAAKSLPWEQDTIVNVWSTTKTMSALCALVLADRGEIDLYAPVTRYWPAFGQNGKEKIEVRHFMSHSAGLAGTDEPIRGEALYDWERVVNALERQAPWWEPGTASGYHAITQGHLIGEVVRRVTGMSCGTFFRREIAEPLGADFHIGTAPEHFSRIGDLLPPGVSLGGALAHEPSGRGGGEGRAASIAVRAFRSPFVRAEDAATAEWREAEIPAANGHGNARSVARIQTVIANDGVSAGTRILSEAGCRAVFDEQTHGRDLVLKAPLTFGMGYALLHGQSPRELAFWGGWGGSSVVVAPQSRMCIAYVMNRMEPSLLGDDRGVSLNRAALAVMGRG
jgi:CubicO group peptidase (beta-lactamase class C family)